MKAKEMFKELGFEYSNCHNPISKKLLLTRYEKKDIEIVFDNATENYFVYGNEYVYWFSKLLHQAIHKQMEELGWI